MSLPSWLSAMGIPPAHVRRGRAVNGSACRFVLNCSSDHRVWVIDVDGGWIKGSEIKRVDHALFVECASSKRAFFLVELKGKRFKEGLEQVESTLEHLEHLPAWRVERSKMEVTAAVIVSNENEVGRYQREADKIRRRFNVRIVAKSVELNQSCPC